MGAGTRSLCPPSTPTSLPPRAPPLYAAPLPPAPQLPACFSLPQDALCLCSQQLLCLMLTSDHPYQPGKLCAWLKEIAATAPAAQDGREPPAS